MNKITVETKFKVGDGVWFADLFYDKKPVPCTFCNTTGIVTGADNTVRSCPKCYGQKQVEIECNQQWACYAKPVVIQEIHIYYAADKVKYHYMMGRHPGDFAVTPFREERIFSSVEEAQVECDRKNKEDNYGPATLDGTREG